jgi:hypothetical protein
MIKCVHVDCSMFTCTTAHARRMTAACSPKGTSYACGRGCNAGNCHKGPGNRCDCNEGYCWQYTGKKYAGNLWSGWQCTRKAEEAVSEADQEAAVDAACGTARCKRNPKCKKACAAATLYFALGIPGGVLVVHCVSHCVLSVAVYI